MALDEAMLEILTEPIIRFYRWPRREITIGVFAPCSAVADRSEPVTRRWTGGGVVEHGDDLTFSLVIPRPCLNPLARAADLYRGIHEAIALALRDAGLAEARAVPVLDSAPDRPGFCFSAPVAWDVMCETTGTKLGGGAQRHSRAGLLHQGSLLLPEPWISLEHPWIAEFVANLSGVSPGAAPSREMIDTLKSRADRLERERYALPEWRNRR